MGWYDWVGTVESDGGKCDPLLLVSFIGIVVVAKCNSWGCGYTDYIWISQCSAHYIVVLHCNVLPGFILPAFPPVNAEKFQAFHTSTCSKRQQANTFACVFKCVFWSMFFEGKLCLLVGTGQIEEPVCTCKPFFSHCQHCQQMTLDIFFKAQCPGSKWLNDKGLFKKPHKPKQAHPKCRV